MQDTGCGVLGANGAPLSSAAHPGDWPWRGWGAGRANGPHRVLQIHRLSHSAAGGGTGSIPPIHLTRQKRGGKKPTPGGWGSELVRLPLCRSELVKVCPLTIPFASFKQ